MLCQCFLSIGITCIRCCSLPLISRLLERKTTSKIALPAKGFWEPWNLGLDFKNDYSNIFFCVQVLLDVQAEFWDFAVGDAQFCIGWKQCMMQWVLLQWLKFFWLHSHLIQAGVDGLNSCRCRIRMCLARLDVLRPFACATCANFSSNCVDMRKCKDFSRVGFDDCISSSFLLYLFIWFR